MKRIVHILSALLLTSSLSWGANIVWSNSNDGTYSTVGNWYGGAVPGITDRAIWASNYNLTVSLTATATNMSSAFLRGNTIWDLGSQSLVVSNLFVGSNDVASCSVRLGSGDVRVLNVATIGTNMPFNILTVGSGARLISGGLTMGGTAAGNSNSLYVTGGGKVSSLGFAMGAAGMSNTLVIAGAGSTVSNLSFNCGGGGRNNAVFITNGGSLFVTNGAFALGGTAGGSNCAMVVSGSGSRFALLNGGGVTLGAANSRNTSLVVSDGALFAVVSSGNQTAFYGANIQILDSTFTNAGASMRFTGNSANPTTILFRNSLCYNATDTRLGETGGKDFFAVDSNAVYTVNSFISVGYGLSSNNVFSVSNGSKVFVQGGVRLGYVAGAYSNTFQVDNSTIWIRDGIGSGTNVSTTANLFKVSNGGSVTSGPVNIGSNSTMLVMSGSKMTITNLVSNLGNIVVTDWYGLPGQAGMNTRLWTSNALSQSLLNSIQFTGYSGATRLASGEVVPTQKIPDGHGGGMMILK